MCVAAVSFTHAPWKLIKSLQSNQKSSPLSQTTHELMQCLRCFISNFQNSLLLCVIVSGRMRGWVHTSLGKGSHILRLPWHQHLHMLFPQLQIASAIMPSSWYLLLLYGFKTSFASCHHNKRRVNHSQNGIFCFVMSYFYVYNIILYMFMLI